MLILMAVIDKSADRPIYRQLADLLRAAIMAEKIKPGSELPSESRLAQEHGIGRDAVRDALALLRAEGHIVTERGRPSRVRERPTVTTVVAHIGDTISARMPKPEERRAFEVAEGVPLLIVTSSDGASAIHPADRTQVRVERRDGSSA